MKTCEGKKQVDMYWREKKKLSRNSSSIKDGVSASALDIQESSAKDSPLNFSDQAPASAHTEGEVLAICHTSLLSKENDSHGNDGIALAEFSDEKPPCSSADLKKTQEEAEVIKSQDMDCGEKLNKRRNASISSGTDQEIHAGGGLPSHSLTNDEFVEEDDGNCVLEVVEQKPGKMYQGKRRKLSRNSSCIKDVASPSTLDILEGSDSSFTFSDQAPAFGHIEKMMGEVASVGHTSLLSKENDSHGIGLVECPDGERASCDKEKKIKNEGLEKSGDEHAIVNDAFFIDIRNEEPQLAPGKLRKKLLVLDVNGILIDMVLCVSEGYKSDTIISRKEVFKRPFSDDFLQFCFERFHVGVWSSRTKRNLELVVEFLMGESKSKLLFCWDQSHCTDTGSSTLENRDKPLFLKELKKLWEKHEPDLPWEKGDYNESNTLLLDDSPYKALRNPPYTAIFPNPYSYKDVDDNSLGHGGELRVYLEGLASADNIQKYVEMNPIGQPAITETNGSWPFYLKVIGNTSSL